MKSATQKTAASTLDQFSDEGFEPLQSKGSDRKFITFSKMEEGESVIGIFMGVQDGKFGPEASLKGADGVEQIFVLTAGLSDFRDETKIPVGTMCKVTHNGLKSGKSGKSYRSYSIFTKRV